MTDKQKEAIETFEELKRNKEIIKNIDKDFFFEFGETALNLIQTQQAEIEKKENEKQIHIKLEQQYKKEYLDTKEELEKKDRQIDKMAGYICVTAYDNIIKKIKDDDIAYWGVEGSIKQYFERKVENGN